MQGSRFLLYSYDLNNLKYLFQLLIIACSLIHRILLSWRGCGICVRRALGLGHVRLEFARVGDCCRDAVGSFRQCMRVRGAGREHAI